jgi:hypothetical protein
MSEITQFKIVGPDDLFEILVVKRINTLEISTNFNPGEYPEFTKGIKDHPYIKTLFEATMAENKTAYLPYGYIAVVYENYDPEIFHEDLQTMIEVYLYENTETMAPTIGTAN